MKNNYILNFLMLLVLQCSFCFTQGQITFQKIYNVSIDRSAKDILPTDDGGYIIAGSTSTSILNDLDIHIVKTNSTGDISWTKNYGGSKPDYPNCILKTADGDYLIAGYTQSSSTYEYNTYLIKINSSGDTLWTKRYGGFGYEEAKEIIATSDGNYVMVGISNSINYNDYNVQLIKIDPNGGVIWSKTYGGLNYDSGHSVKECIDGGLIVIGKTGNFSQSPLASIFMIKTNSDGDTMWTKTFSGPNSYEGKYILANSDGSFTLCADDSTGSRNSDVKIMKTDENGVIIWEKKYGGLDKDVCKVIQPTSDGGYILSSISRAFGSDNPNFWLLKLDASGDTTWTVRYGGSGHEHCYTAKQTSDGGYISVGHSRSFSPNTQIMFLKLNQNGKLGPVSVDELAMNPIRVYPNPSHGTIKVDLGENLTASTLKIRNALGQEIFSEVIEASGRSDGKTIDLNGKQPGIYFLTIQSTNNSTTQKLLIE